MITIVVSGRNGFIGNALVAYLKRKHRVISIVRKRVDAFDYSSEVVVEKNITSLLEDDIAQHQPDVFIHLAGVVYSGLSGQYTDNIAMTQAVASICSSLDLPLVFSSTANVTTSNSKLDPYARSKLHSERLIARSCKKYSIVRFPLVVGENSPIVKAIERHLSRWRFLPLIGRQQGRVQPVPINKLIRCLVEHIADPTSISKELTIVGREIYTYGELWKNIARHSRLPHIQLEVPESLAILMMRCLKFIGRSTAVNIEQIKGLKTDKLISVECHQTNCFIIDNQVNQLFDY